MAFRLTQGLGHLAESKAGGWVASIGFNSLTLSVTAHS
jgi:hypothetical protein